MINSSVLAECRKQMSGLSIASEHTKVYKDECCVSCEKNEYYNTFYFYNLFLFLQLTLRIWNWVYMLISKRFKGMVQNIG